MRMIDVKLERVAKALHGNSKKSFSLFSQFFKITLFLSTVLLFAGLKGYNSKSGSGIIEEYGNEFQENFDTLIAVDQKDQPFQNHVNHLVFQFYSDRQFKPCWTTNFKTNQQYNELINLFKSAGKYGLFSGDYAINALDSSELMMITSDGIQKKISNRIELEKLATQSAFKLLINLSLGLNPSDSMLAISDFIKGLPLYLGYVCSCNKLSEGFLAVMPHSYQFRLLQSALQNYLRTVRIDTFHFTLRQLKASDSLVALSLVNLGYLLADSLKDPKCVEVAIKKLQKAYNLKVTGKKDEKSLEALSKSTVDIFNVIAVNLDRCRKDNLIDGNCIIVNIPEYRLYYYDIIGDVTTYNVIVGKPLTPTPLLASRLDRIILNPIWNVPRSIMMSEIIPKMQSDSLYMSKHDFSLIDDNNKQVDVNKINWNKVDEHQFKFYIRQRNCDNNALGAVKFLFPNQYSVYLHDTPSRLLFGNEFRALSHGCVRVQYPEKLAQQIIMNENNPSYQSIDFGNLLRSKETSEIRLSEPIPIYISYYTCTADSTGEINFHPDIYALDNQSIQNLISRNFQ